MSARKVNLFLSQSMESGNTMSIWQEAAQGVTAFSMPLWGNRGTPHLFRPPALRG